MQVAAGTERCLGLMCALLHFAKLGQGFGECGKPDDQPQRLECAVVGEVCVGGNEPGGVPEPVPDRGRCRDAAVLQAGGAVKIVGGLSQGAAAERGSGDPQGVSGRPGGVGGSGRVGCCEVRDLLGGLTGDAGGVFP